MRCSLVLEGGSLTHGGRTIHPALGLAQQRVRPGSVVVVTAAPVSGAFRALPPEATGPDLALLVWLPSGRLMALDAYS